MKLTPKNNLKLIIILGIGILSLAVYYIADDKEAFINFFFIPTLLASYIYDARGGVIAAVISVIFVSLISFFSVDNYVEFIIKRVLVWGCFLIIAGYTVGKLTEQINDAYLGTITTLAIAMESRDPYVYGHSSRVAEVSVRIAKKLGLPKYEQNLIRAAGMLHDIGKFGIREDVLRKSGPLTKEEYDHVRQHPLIGVSILSPVRLLKDIIPYIYYHHERLDGTGYLRKKGYDIPLGARILAVADVYEAMTADRPYRKALSREKILEIFKEKSDQEFDKEVVNALLKITDNLRVNIVADKKSKYRI